MSGLFGSSGTQDTQTSRQTDFNRTATPTFMPEMQGLLTQAIGQAGQDSVLDPMARGFFEQMLGQQAGQVNPYMQQQADVARTLAGDQLGQGLAQIRSQYAGSPIGRTQLAMGDLVGRTGRETELGILNLLGGQYNQDVSNQMTAANALTQGRVGSIENALQLLGLGRGAQESGREDMRGTETTQTTGRDSLFSNILGLGGTLGALGLGWRNS